MIAVLLAAIGIPVFALIYYSAGDTVSARFCLLSMIGILAAPLVLNVSGSIALARETFVITIFTLPLVITYRHGGMSAPSVIWLVICPLIGMTSGGLRPGLIWAAFCLLAIAGIYAADLNGLFPPVMVADIRLFAMVSMVTFVISIAIFLLFFELTNSNAIRKLEQALKIIGELAVRDDLTGVFNRRELLRIVEQEKNRLERQGSPFSLCLIDLDYFKQINDTYGHAAGDHVLKQVASTIQEQVRKTDCFGRYGGEEFLLLLTGTDAPAAEAFVDRIRRSVEAIQFSELLGAECITISIGIAEYHDHESIEQTISRADQALYDAKRAGRNCVVIAERDIAA